MVNITFMVYTVALLCNIRSDDGASHDTCESSLHEKENRPIPLEPNVVALSSPVKSPNSRALRPTLIELEKVNLIYYLNFCC